MELLTAPCPNENKSLISSGISGVYSSTPPIYPYRHPCHACGVTIRNDSETDRLVGVLARRISERTGRDVVRVATDLLHAVDFAGMDPEQRMELYRERLKAKQLYCVAEGLDFNTYMESQHEAEIKAALARITRALQEEA